jgi:UDP-N-acetyl-D-glucosamine dehydrogenase
VSDTLAQKIDNNSIHVGVLGLGYVGLPLALRFAEVGVRVTGFDIDPAKPPRIAAGESYINYISGEAIRKATAAGFRATGQLADLQTCDVYIICVPTPLGRHHEPDLSYVLDTARSVLPFISHGKLVVLESTTYPGTTDELLQPMYEAGGLKAGQDFHLAFSPERQDPGNTRYDTHNIPKLVGGVTPACTAAAAALYARAVERVVPVSHARVAEMAKLLENIHRAVNIGLVNELKIVADRMGLDIFEVIDAAATKPFGFVPYYPGPGLGGHCIPIDPFYLTWKAREYGLNTRFIELAGEVNRGMPEHVVRKTIDALNERGKSVRGANILLLGIAYKKNVDDLRESPGIELLDRLQDLGAQITYSDPHIPHIPRIRRGTFDLSAAVLDPELLAAQDAVILVADHDLFDFDLIRSKARLIIDTRGRFRNCPQAVRA